MMKRGLFIFMILICASFAYAGLEPLAITGHVYDKVTREAVNLPKVIITCGGNVYTANIKSSAGSSGLDDNGFDWFQCSGSDRTVTIRAELAGDSSCYGEVNVPVTSGQNINQDVYLCCYPVKASGLSPSGAVHFSSGDSVTFMWTAGSKGTGGNRQDSRYDNWDVFNLAGEKVEPATSPITRVIGSSSSWSIQTINGVRGDASRQCSYVVNSNPSQSNSPCAQPFNLIGSYSEGYVHTSWESADIDADGDKCHDEWRGRSMKQGQGLNNAEHDVSFVFPEGNISKNQMIPAELVTYWEVKSCDNFNACSAPAIMITPSCNSISEDCPDVAQIGGGGLFNKNDCRKGAEIPKIISNFPWAIVVSSVFVAGILAYLAWRKFHVRGKVSESKSVKK